ncbi:hypothetical protein HK098_003520, partial [Nowakowskiella sp. JEL0407]
MKRTLMIIKPHAYANMGKILNQVLEHQFVICRTRMLGVSETLANKLLEQHPARSTPEFSSLLSSYIGDRCLAVELMRSDAVENLKSLAGPERVEIAKKLNPTPLRGIYGESVYKNAVHTSLNDHSSKIELDYIFGETSSKRFPRTAKFKNSTLALIRPHAVNSGQTGKIIDMILRNGFEIADLELFFLEPVNAEEFLEVYKGLLPEYHRVLDHITSGAVIA